jgi:ATP-dependent Lon protease
VEPAAPPASDRPARLPLLAVREVVLLPHASLSLSVGREKSIKALEAGMRAGHFVAVTTQKKAALEDPSPDDLYPTGVLAYIDHLLPMPDGTLKAFLQGVCRVRLASIAMSATAGHWQAELVYPEEASTRTPETQAAMRQALQVFEEYLKLSRRAPAESATALAQISDPSRLADTIADKAVTKVEDRQALLELSAPAKRLESVIALVNGEIEILTLDRKIHSRVRAQIQKTQKEYYLTEQMKAIQKELRQKDDFAKEIEEIREKVKAAKMPKAAEEAALKEIGRLEKMMPFSPESTVSRTYLDWMTALPWSKRTKDKLDLKRAADILARDHYGLEKAKDRILEYLAVSRLTRKLRGPILCFVGPPGVGKTSLGRSIAEALGRRFVRISLGGVRDEAEIRGHRRTYIGSLPGRIIQSLRKAKTRNPVFLLDEVDKMGMDWRGDPAAALLEVLDPEQNSTFLDHYLDSEFDLSSVMFVCTANTLEGIPVSLLDRLEILRFAGYTQAEKLAIAKAHLLPKQVRLHGLKETQVAISDAALERAIQEYTREAGVRNLEREIANMCRKAAREVVEKGPATVAVDAENLPKFLGIPKYQPEEKSQNAVGVATGLAWTEVGGQILHIEVISYPGKGEIQITGKLGTVMQESAKAALSYIKAVAGRLGVSDAIFRNRNFHIHVPEGAVPKDGPSAGVALATALASHVTGRPVIERLAMTGEITLQGRVLPIGGLKEKVLAAHRSGVKIVLFPEGNRKDLEEIPAEVQAALQLKPVSSVDEVLSLALMPVARKGRSARTPAAPDWKGRQAGSPAPGYTPPPA